MYHKTAILQIKLLWIIMWI